LVEYSDLRDGNINHTKEYITRLYEQGAETVSIGQ